MTSYSKKLNAVFFLNSCPKHNVWSLLTPVSDTMFFQNYCLKSAFNGSLCDHLIIDIVDHLEIGETI